MRVLAAVFGAGALLAVAVSTTASQTTGQATGARLPRLAIESTDGHDSYAFYCASCHGPEGRGDGPVAPVLTRPPTDLTRLAAAHDGRFPTDRVRGSIVGDAPVPTVAHGSKAMPVWGPIFRGLDPDDRRTEVRIASLLAYLESIQVK